MTLQAAIEAELPRLRAEAEARMTSTCTIRRKSGNWVQNEVTGEEEAEWAATHTDIPFRLGGSYRGDSPTRRLEVGDVELQAAVRVGHLPASTTDLEDGDYIDVTSGENEGAAFRIVEATWQDQATARRVPLLAVDRPEEW